jgi:uncharacterized protein YndB with AHSA1/START domain
MTMGMTGMCGLLRAPPSRRRLIRCNFLVAHIIRNHEVAHQEIAMPAIVREVTLTVPPDEAWAALTDPEQLEVWFADEVAALDPVPGGEAVFRWEDDGTRRAIVEEVEEGRRLAFRWEPAPHEAEEQGGPGTRVEFTLHPVPEGTRLVVVESGWSVAALLAAPSVGPRLSTLAGACSLALA